MIALTAAVQNIGYVAGDNITVPFAFYDDLGATIDVTGWTFTFLIEKCNGTTLFTLTAGSGIVVSGNTATVSLTQAQSANADLDCATFKLSAVASSLKRTYVTGEFKKQKI